MHRKFLVHLKHNLVGYVALFAALGGTSYAAVRLKDGSVTSRALATGAVTHSKLAVNSINGKNIMKGSLTGAAFAPGLLKGSAGTNGTNGTAGGNGSRGVAGPAGPQGAAGIDGNGAIVARARSAGSVAAPHGASTSVPLGSGTTWNQAPGEINLVTGSVTMTTPSACTGSFGNALNIQVDGVPATFALAPTAPASTTVTMPIAVMSLMEPAGSTSHRITASLGNSCTKGGEDFTVSDVKLDILKFS
jgi:hypothetical protein